MSAVQSSGGASVFERTGTRVVALLLLLELFCVALLWSLDPVAQEAQASFALYLAAVLMAFAMISYVYRALKSSDRFSRLPLLVGSCFIVVLMLLGLVY